MPHVPDQKKQLTPFHLLGTHDQGFGMVDSSRSIFAYQLSAIFGTALRSWSSLTSLSLPWWRRLEQKKKKKCDYDYDYICMLIERFHASIPCLSPYVCGFVERKCGAKWNSVSSSWLNVSTIQHNTRHFYTGTSTHPWYSIQPGIQCRLIFMEHNMIG